MTAISRHARQTLLPAIIAAMAALSLASSPAEAQTSATWTGGGGNGTWSNALNWSTLPTTSGSWNLVFGGTTQTTTINNIGTISVSSLAFTNDGSDGRSSAFTVSGSSLALLNATITTTATNGGTIVAGGDTLGLRDSLTITGANVVTLGAGHNLGFTNSVDGTGSLAFGVSSGNAIAYLSGSNSYSGGTTITGGQVRTADSGATDGFNNNAFGTGNVVVSGSGSVALRNGTTLANNFTIGGVGLTSSGSQGAIRGSFSTSSRMATISGAVALSSNALITTANSSAITGSRLSLSGPVDLGSSTLTLAPDLASTNSTSSQIIISGSIFGTGAVVVTGSDRSTVLLSGNNGYSGGTTLSSGTLAVGASRALGTGSATINGGVLDLNGQALSVGGLSSGTAAVIRSSVAGPASLTTTTDSNATLAGSITDGSGVVSLTKAGGGTIYMSGSNSYSGDTTVTGGQIRTAANGVADGFNNSAFGTGNVIVSGSGSVVLRNGTTLANNFTIGGIGLSSSGTQGAIRGSFSTSNRTATISGSVALSSNATITTAASNGITGSRLSLTGPVSLGASTLTLAPDICVTNSTSSQIVISGSVAGTGAIVVSGSLQSSVLLSGNNSYSGGTTLASGTLMVGAGRALGSGSATINGGVLDLNGQALSVGGLSSGTAAVIRSSVAGPASVTTTTDSNATLAGSITDGAGIVSLTKAGAGIIYMSGSNSYSGNTTVTGGQIRTAANGANDGFNNNAFGTGNVVVSGSGSVALRNGTTLANNFTIGGEGLSASGTQGAIRGSFSTSGRTATVSGSISLSADATIVTAANANITDSKLVLAGPINLGSYDLTFKPNKASGVARFSDTTAVPVVVTGTMTGSGDVIVAGDSAVYMNGVNSSTGATTVRSGALGGNGSIAGIVTVESGAFLAPGSAANTTGALGVGGLQLNSGATAEMMISGTGVGLYDQVVALNNVSFGGALALDFTQNGFAIGTVWQLFTGGTFSGSFSSVTMTGSYGSPSFSYIGSGEWKADLGGGQSLSFYENDSHGFRGKFMAGQLVLVPEPSSIVAAGIGIAVACWSASRQRRASRRRDTSGS